MVIDTSALIAILFGEAEATIFSRTIADDARKLISAFNALETMIVVEARKGEAGGRELDLLLHRAQIEIVAMNADQAEIARAAWRKRKSTVKYRWDLKRMKAYLFDAQLVVDICRQNDVGMVGVFGSMARGEATPTSDVDLLIRFTQKKSLLAMVRLERQLSEAIGRKVDLLTEAAISPYLRSHILHELQILYETR